ncbi:condensin-2 complex subunit H2 [Brienomyrus brachyistius]|uniref:condensin-2 complex subunit H2 n=1 Tax=Brienomyrus brachyistius TaxID=42636 RepID=UPI0020B3B70F|nr:condensin-2 complex subunit H2 [Brienomyrus brachyistius]XP_048867594.1 condensin-2 complex subunit H2 [Brienomyrus brachyistius]XP_048867604.1 condensin-2 complex subunit H2 [Brienomyrus brachyistius]XP_048867615.1 condensin-2 complex subunit H2 [Brienomyrus brachyistius]XP_048867624.1 condensin-2 complex subunit H2 [Brienomyrus brachyistius]
MMDTAETRFAHLLQPIRDLTKNWEVDVASQLGEYLDELDQICISFDEGKTTMNFAEAALLIQGSACIYSKKVEYLYSLVYQALDLISNKKRDKQPVSVGQDGTDSDVTVANKDQMEFLTLDDISEKNSPAVDMKKDIADGMEIVALTPEPLIPAEELEKKKNPLYSCRGELLASCRDFRMNSCTPHASGIIRLDPGLSPSHFLKAKTQWNSDGSCGAAPDGNDDDAPLPVLNLSAAPDEEPAQFPYENRNEADVFLPLEDCGIEVDQPPSPHVDRHQAPNEKRMLRERPATQHPPEQQKELPDLWQWLDPFSTSEEKPLKMGKQFTIPRGVQDVSGNKRKRKGTSKIQDFMSWFNGTSSEASNHKPKKGPTFADLLDIYWSHMKERQKMQKTFQRKAGLMSFPNELELEDAERQAEELQAQHEMIQDQDAGDDFSDHENYLDEEQPAVLEEQNLPITASQTEKMSYEDLVRRNVELFLVNSQKYAQETVLSRRVKDWEEKIGPQLAEEEERPPFDIHSYGNNVVSMFRDIGQRLSFASLVQGKDNHEVCRYMLASLQLANDYTVEIEQDEGLEESLDTMTLSLLSKQRAHERFQTYTAPSINNMQ